MKNSKSVEKRQPPVCIHDLTKEELDAMLQEALDSIKAGEVYTADEVEAELAKEFGISFD